MDEKALTELLECSVCLEQLDSTSKVLQCQHTFCRRCLEEIVSTKHELRCPECRFLVECPVDELPSNILLMRLLEGLKTQRGAGTSGDKWKHSGSAGQNSSAWKATSTARQSQPRQGNGKSKPCAKALFNYNGKDPGDLSLKKGDIVFLRKQVDANWYHGELNGQHGFFPANFVQVITPLSSVPQCKALYDFDIDEDKEGDCLSLKKDEVVTVIRKVDDNWIEGRKGDKIGIFPISFGELNDPAKILLRLSGNTSTPEDKGPPATPAQPSKPIPKASSPPPVLPSLFEDDFASLLSQGAQQNKRHSLDNLSASSQPTNQGLPQRRSLNISPDLTQVMAPSESSTAASCLLPETVLPGSSHEADDQDHPLVTYPPALPAMSAETSKPALPSSATNSAKHIPPAPSAAEDLPFSGTVYVALYNYKPQKLDELELRKGDNYTVTEKCQDGWYKGQCMKTMTLGVFPGNYVQAKSHNSAFKPVSKNGGSKSKAQASAGTGNATGSATSQTNPGPPRPKTSPARSAGSVDPARPSSVDPTGQSSIQDALPPPIVPRTGKLVSPEQPRQHSSGSKTPKSSSAKPSASSSSPSSPVLQPSSKMTRYVRASKSISPKVGSGAAEPSMHDPKSSHDSKSSRKSSAGPVASNSSSSPIWKHSLSASANITPPNMVVGATGKAGPTQGATSAASGHASGSSGKKEKKEKDKLSLMKKLVSGGKSKKSRASDADTSSLSDSSISHSRSGSYPSELVAGTLAEGGHKKSGSFDSSAQAGQRRPSRPKPLVREKYRSVETYPAQSEIELDLKVGDIIYVHKKREDGWFKGTLQRSGKTGLFPGSFVDKCE